MKTKEIAKDEWPKFFDDISRQYLGRLATLEIFGAEIGAQVQERELSFEGIVNESTGVQGSQIVVMMGAKPDDHITHSISRPTQVSMSTEQSDQGTSAALEIKSADGVTALVRFLSPVLPEMVDVVVDHPTPLM